MMIDLVDGEPIVFGAERDKGVMINDGRAEVVSIDDVGIDSILVHHSDADPSVAFALGRIGQGSSEPDRFRCVPARWPRRSMPTP